MRVIINKTVSFPDGIPTSVRKALGKLEPDDRDFLGIREGQFPIGILDFIKEKVEIHDERRAGGVLSLPAIKTKLKRFQEDGVIQLLEKTHGYMEAPTGSGKTLMAFEVAVRLHTRTLFVVHRVGLAKQAVEMAENELRIMPGFVGERKRLEGKSMTMAVAQSIVRKPLKDAYGLLIFDEAHHLAAKTIATILSQYSARYKYGFTATLGRSDKRAKLFPYLLGKHKVIVTISDALELLNLPDIVPYKTGLSTAADEFCEKNCKISKDCKNKLDCQFFCARMYVFLCGWVNRPGRNEQVVKHAKKLRQIGYHSIGILTSRKDHAKNLAKLLSIDDAPLTVCVGKIDEFALDEFRLFGGYLVGTESLLGEGIDLPDMDALLLAAPAGGRTKVKQRAGRLMRGSGHKLLIDYCDEDEYSIQRGWWPRRLIYKSMGLRFVSARRVFGEEAERNDRKGT